MWHDVVEELVLLREGDRLVGRIELQGLQCLRLS